MFASSAYADGSMLSDYGGGTYHTSRGYNSQATIAQEGLWYADHNTTEWQELGAPNGYGVSWSSNGGEFGHDDLYVGDTVTFRFNMHSENVGNHYANILKGWIDWGTDANSYTFGDDNDVVSGFKTLRDYKGDTAQDHYTFDYGYNDYYNHNDEGYGNDNYEVTTAAITITEDMVGTAYLRARVTCSDSLSQSVLGYYSWDRQWYISADDYLTAFNAYADYGQGEIEDWKINVLNGGGGGGDPVPEPATLVLFGMGLIGLARVGRKKAKH